MRALPLEFSSDPGSRAVSDQFMFGSALLISPVTVEGATQRKVYLPAGSDWVDFWTGKHANGGQSITAEAPVKESQSMPVVARLFPLDRWYNRPRARRTRLICASILAPTATSRSTKMKGTTTTMSTGPVGHSHPLG